MITLDKRKKCKACRFKLCLDAGMCMESMLINLNQIKKKIILNFFKIEIKMGRISKVEKMKLKQNKVLKNSNDGIYFFLFKLVYI